MIRWPVPDDVFLDTGVVIAAIYPGTPDSSAASTFCADLAEAERRIYFSAALRLEFAHALRRLATKPDRLPAETYSAYGLDRWRNHPLIRRRWLSNGVSRFNAFVRQFPAVIEVPVSDENWTASVEHMATETLDATDAFHVAAARALKINDFAPTDSDFRRIASPRIHLIRDTEDG